MNSIIENLKAVANEIELSRNKRKTANNSPVTLVAVTKNHGVEMMQQAIDHATDVLAGGTGGYIVIGRNADGQPAEAYRHSRPHSLARHRRLSAYPHRPCST